MSGLMTPHTAPDGRRMMVDSTLLDIDARIKRGDPTTGWVGDESMWLEFDQVRNVFIVCRCDPATGRVVDVLSWPPPLDARLLTRLADGDTHRPGNDPFARMVAAEEKRERDAAADFDTEIEEEVAPRLLHAMRKGGLDVDEPKPVFFPGGEE